MYSMSIDVMYANNNLVISEGVEESTRGSSITPWVLVYLYTRLFCISG